MPMAWLFVLIMMWGECCRPLLHNSNSGILANTKMHHQEPTLHLKHSLIIRFPCLNVNPIIQSKPSQDKPTTKPQTLHRHRHSKWALLERSIQLLKQISLIEIVSTCSAASYCCCRSSRVFHAVDSATLQVTHRCTPAPYGMLTALPRHSFGDVNPCLDSDLRTLC